MIVVLFVTWILGVIAFLCYTWLVIQGLFGEDE